MKREVPFDISYRDRIENGEVDLVMNGHPVEILKWDMRTMKGSRIVGLIKGCEEEHVYVWNEKGEYPGNPEYNLYMIVDEGLTEFEQAVKDSMFYDVCYEPTDEDVVRQEEKLLGLAKREVMKDMPKWQKCDGVISDEPRIWDEDYLVLNGYLLVIPELVEKLEKEDET